MAARIHHHHHQQQQQHHALANPHAHPLSRDALPQSDMDIDFHEKTLNSTQNSISASLALDVNNSNAITATGGLPQGSAVAANDTQPIDEEPLYVNAKQYYRILKRRVARARIEELHRLSRQRKVRL